jgi:hypothetical protein
MVSAPVRVDVLALAPALTVTTPPPVPPAPLVIDSQLESARAVHEQLLPVEIVTDLDPPSAPNEREVDESV